MTSQRKKVYERTTLEAFLRRASIPAVLLEGNFEAPDAVIELANRQIGVEITEIQKSREEREARSIKEDLLRRTRQRYQTVDAPPISVTLSFHLLADLREIRRTLRKNVLDDLARQTAEVLYANARPYEKGVVVLSNQQLPPDLRPWLRELRFWGSEGTSIWQISEASWVAPLTASVLQERVDAKTRRLTDYRLNGYPEYWLLICADPLNPACRFEPARDFDPATITSPFDRTFFYDAWFLIELGLSST